MVMLSIAKSLQKCVIYVFVLAYFKVCKSLINDDKKDTLFLFLPAINELLKPYFNKFVRICTYVLMFSHMYTFWLNGHTKGTACVQMTMAAIHT